MDMTIGAPALLERLGEAGLLVVDTRDAAAWAEATVPGAVRLGVYDYFIPSSDAAGLAAIAAATHRALAAAGIDRARTTVWLEERTGMVSPRGLWFQELAGLAGGLVLDGGIEAWRQAGGPVAPGTGHSGEIVAADRPAGPGGPAAAIRRDLIVTIDEILARDPARTDLLDVRRPSEFDGSFVHPCCRRAGRLPDAKLLFWEDLLEDGRYRPAAEIAARAAEAGLSPDREVVAYCHRGARAATALYALRRAGYARVRVFVGSWHEWAAREDLPIETGQPA